MHKKTVHVTVALNLQRGGKGFPDQMVEDAAVIIAQNLETRIALPEGVVIKGMTPVAVQIPGPDAFEALQQTARAVIERWGKGDLVEAVRELDKALKATRPAQGYDYPLRRQVAAE